ncbi:alpha/beta hydrolase family protein [Paenibacillus rhizophilus]|uniref:Platelet-activating factor acetylhydrolase plasma/intracellular isoform II n=1 Tax=Paenibacillus rhizophilus TaxID=1850366 RepID=A0A3N9PB17_9BACL|nr:alpha/beta fold hydrolase [Paenibacillus rhizophilus]RQW12174.1 Platelet-activating factor acetylhydrolase plasma/intracellular isoform II [Paenibacillus rhizophilus]
MRMLEMTLAALDLLVLFYFVFAKPTSPRKTTNMLIGAGLLTIPVLQLLLEGYRWQLVPLYFVTLILLGSILLRLFRPVPAVKKRRVLRYINGLALSVLVILSTVLAAALPVIDLPKPDGADAVGTATFDWIDGNREETLTTDPGDKRELVVQVWYPAEKTDGPPQFLFPQDPQIFHNYISAFAEGLHLPAFALDYWKYARSHSFHDAPVLPSLKPYPLVIISHGLGTSRMLHASQAENLASHGYIVAAIDHTYSTAATAFSDGRITGFKTELSAEDIYDKAPAIGEIWTQDVEFVLNQLDSLNAGRVESDFKGKIDLDNVGIMGHSFGGATAYNAAYTIDKIKAGINMDGSLLELDRDQLNKPFMFLQSDASANIIEALDDPAVPEEIRERFAKETQIARHVVERGGKSIHIKGTAHFNFTDLQFYSPLIKYMGMTGSIDGDRGAYLVNRYVLDFFDKYLKGGAGELINGPHADDPEIDFQTL